MNIQENKIKLFWFEVDSTQSGANLNVNFISDFFWQFDSHPHQKARERVKRDQTRPNKNNVSFSSSKKKNNVSFNIYKDINNFISCTCQRS